MRQSSSQAALEMRIRTLIADGATREIVVSELRRLGLTMIESVELCKQLYGLPYLDAKMLVHCSPTWSDVRERYNQ